MFERVATSCVTFFGRHARVIMLTLAGVLIADGLRRGMFTPGWLDFGFVAAVIVYRLGLLRTVLVGSGFLFLLVALTPPICSGSREKAYGAAMKSDLKNLASQQEIYFSDNYTYTTSATDLAFTHSDGVSVTIVAVGTGWSAWATHRALGPSVGCAIYYGDISESLRKIGEATPSQPAEIACTDW